MAKLRKDHDYSDGDLSGLAREEFVKALVHGQEVQTGNHRRRTFSINEYLKAIATAAELEAAAAGNAIVRQSVFLGGRR